MKKLVRATEHKMIGGVCAGLAQYFSIDPIIIRLIFVVGAFSSVGGFVAIYLLMWMLVPKFRANAFRVSYTDGSSEQSAYTDTFTVPGDSFSDNDDYIGAIPMNDTITSSPRKSNMVGGVILITLGCILLANNFFPDIDIFDYWPLLLVGVGVGVLIRALRSNNDM